MNITRKSITRPGTAANKFAPTIESLPDDSKYPRLRLKHEAISMHKASCLLLCRSQFIQRAVVLAGF